MTRLEWEASLVLNLKSMPQEEIDAAIEYYREMYGDKRDAGLTTEEILREFGDPALCAKRIILESRCENENKKTASKRISPHETAEQNVAKSEKSAVNYNTGVSVSDIVGAVFFTLLLVIPFAAVLISLIASFGAVTVSGCAMVIAGVIFTIASPFLSFFGVTFHATIANIGLGIATAGVGAVLAVVFFLLTKYMSILSYKAIKAIYKRKKA